MLGQLVALFEAAGRCQIRAAEARVGWRNLMRAITLYQERGDGIGQARATLELPGSGAAPERLAGIAVTPLGRKSLQGHLGGKLRLGAPSGGRSVPPYSSPGRTMPHLKRRVGLDEPVALSEVR